MKAKVKRIIISLLIVSMILTNVGFAALANSPLDGEVTGNKDDLTHKYYDELKNEEKDSVTTSTDSDADKDTEVATDSESESDDDMDDISTSTDSEASEDNINDNTDTKNVDKATDSEVYNDLEVATNSDSQQSDDIATNSNINLSTESKIDLSIDIPTDENKPSTNTIDNNSYGAGAYNLSDDIDTLLWPQIKYFINSNTILTIGSDIASPDFKQMAVRRDPSNAKVAVAEADDKHYGALADYWYVKGRKGWTVGRCMPYIKNNDSLTVGRNRFVFLGVIAIGFDKGDAGDARNQCDFAWNGEECGAGSDYTKWFYWYPTTTLGTAYVPQVWKDNANVTGWRSLEYGDYIPSDFKSEFKNEPYRYPEVQWPNSSSYFTDVPRDIAPKVKINNQTKNQSFKELILDKISFANTVGALSNNANLEKVTFTSNAEIETMTDATSLFENDAKLKEVIVNRPNGFASISNATKMFKGCSDLKTISLTGNMAMNSVTNMESMFEDCTSLEEVDLGSIDFDTITNSKNMFKGCTNLRVIKSSSSYVVNLNADTSDMFDGCVNLVGGGGFAFNPNFIDGTYANIDAGGILPGYFTFNGVASDIVLDSTWASNITKANIKKIRLTNSAVMESADSDFVLPTLLSGIPSQHTKGYLKDNGETLLIHFARQIPALKASANWSNFFKNFTNLETVEGLDLIDASGVTNMESLFENCTSLTSVTLNPNTEKATNMSKVFYNCSNLSEIHIGSNLKLEKVKNLESAFENCRDLSVFDIGIASFSSIESLKNAFKNCVSLTEFSFDVCDTPTLTNTEGMFSGCSNLSTIYVNKNFQGLSGINYVNMFEGCTKLMGGQGFGYTATDPNAGSGEFARVDYGGIMPGYYTLTDPSAYNNVTFNIPANWFNATSKAKSQITKIKFFNDAPTPGGGSAVGAYDEMFVINPTTRTRAFIDGDTVKFHFGHSINKLKVNGSAAGFFKDFTSLTVVEGLETLVDVTNVTDISELFSGCTSLTTVSLNPNTENVTNMSKVFYNCASLSQVHIGSQLKLDKVKNLESAFENCKKLSVLDIGIASFSSIENLKNAFKNCESLAAFNFDVCPLDHLQTTEGMFDGCKNLTRIYCNDNFQGLQHISYDNMFNGCVKLIGGEGFTYSPTEPKSKSGEFARVDYGGIMPGYYTILNTAKYRTVTFDLETDWYRSKMLPKDQVLKIKFFNASQDAGGIGAYDEMFYMSDADKTRAYVEVSTKTVKIHYGHDIDTLKFRGDVEGMFQNFVNLTEIEGMENLDASRIENMSGMFANCKKIKTATIPNGLINAATLSELFKNCESLESVQFGSGVQIENVENLDGMFENCPALKTVDFGTAFDMSNVTSMDRMFKDCASLTSIKFNQNINTGMIESTREMFAGCSSLTNESLAAIASLDVRNVKDMGYMFASCSSIKKADFTNIEVNELTNMEGMFSGCKDLTDVSFGAKFDTSKVTNMRHLFEGCENLKGTPLNQNINTNPKKTSFLAKLFGDGNNNDPTNYNVLDLSDLNTENVTDMSGMFLNCRDINVIDISNINTESVEDMSEMFANCPELTYIVSKDFATASVITSTDMFKNCPKLIGGEGTEWAKTKILDNVYAVVDMGPNSAKPGYFTWGDVYITYNGGEGATGSMEREVVERFTTHTLALNQFTRPGYTFFGWDDEDGNSYLDGKEIRLAKSTVLTAVWNKGGGNPSGGGPSGGGSGNNNIPTSDKGITPFYDSNNSKYVTEIDFVFHTMLENNDFEWEYNEKGERNSIKVKKSSDIAKAFMAQDEYSSHYIDNPNSDYINLRKGFFNIEHNGGGFYFGFDDMGKRIAGFIVTTPKTGDYQINPADNTIIEIGKKNSAKYYLYNGTDENKNAGDYKGMVWNAPSVISKIEYIFDPEGRVVSEKVIKDSKGESIFNKGMWEYNPSSNEWRYFTKDESGKRMYVNDTIAAIKDRAENDHYYIFGLDGVMKKGLIEYMGQTYYLIENGANEGSMYIGNITLDGKDYVFNENGLVSVSVASMSKSE